MFCSVRPLPRRLHCKSGRERSLPLSVPMILVPAENKQTDDRGAGIRNVNLVRRPEPKSIRRNAGGFEPWQVVTIIAAFQPLHVPLKSRITFQEWRHVRVEDQSNSSSLGLEPDLAMRRYREAEIMAESIARQPPGGNRHKDEQTENAYHGRRPLCGHAWFRTRRGYTHHAYIRRRFIGGWKFNVGRASVRI